MFKKKNWTKLIWNRKWKTVTIFLFGKTEKKKNFFCLNYGWKFFFIKKKIMCVTSSASIWWLFMQCSSSFFHTYGTLIRLCVFGVISCLFYFDYIVRCISFLSFFISDGLLGFSLSLPLYDTYMESIVLFVWCCRCVYA